MKITITTTLNISQENEALIQVVASQLGYSSGDVNSFISTYLEGDAYKNLYNLITPAVDRYNGLVGKEKTDEIKAQLGGAITCNVTIT